MSFSSEVKEELYKTLPSARHCQIAELAAYLKLLGVESPGVSKGIFLKAETESLKNRVFTLFQKAFKIDVVVTRGKGRSRAQGAVWYLSAEDSESVRAALQALHHRMVLAMECCRRSFLRAAFLASGSISAPEKYYHLEIVSPCESTAEEIMQTMRGFGMDAKTVTRKGDFVVYLKEGEQIVQMLGEMGAGISLLKLENIRVTREVKGNVNRRVNCETANIRKTIVSSHRQVEDIRYLRGRKEYSELPASLREMAEVRLKYPDMPLAELGDHLDPRIGKSGVNHRLRKISQIAAALREKDGPYA